MLRHGQPEAWPVDALVAETERSEVMVLRQVLLYPGKFKVVQTQQFGPLVFSHLRTPDNTGSGDAGRQRSRSNRRRTYSEDED